VYAPQRSLYLRRDGGDSWHLYVKSTAATVNTGWLALPGQEFDYAQITANLAGIAATTEAASQAVIAGNPTARRCGSAFCAEAVLVCIADCDLCRRSRLDGGGAGVRRHGEYDPAGAEFEIFDTPTVGAHTYAVKAFVSTGTLTVNAGAGGSGNLVPGHLRVTKA